MTTGAEHQSEGRPQGNGHGELAGAVTARASAVGIPMTGPREPASAGTAADAVPSPEDRSRYPTLVSATDPRSVHFWAVAQARFYSRKPFNPDAADRERIGRFYPVLVEAFEKRYGSGPYFWCQHIPAGAVLATRRYWGRTRSSLFIAYPPTSNWARSSTLLYDCERLKDEIEDLLRGRARERSLAVLNVAATSALALMDHCAQQERDVSSAVEGTKSAARQPVRGLRRLYARAVAWRSDSRYRDTEAKRIERMLGHVRSYAERAISRTAQLTYLLGMTLGAVAVFAVASLLALHTALSGRPADLIAASVAGGAGGAVLSVLSRLVTDRALTLDPRAGRAILRILGAVRPVLGAAFGFALYVVLEGGLLPFEPRATEKTAVLYAAVGVVAGFSERLAPDMLGAAGKQLRESGGGSD